MVDGEIGQRRRDKPTKDRPLVITEGAGRRSYFGGKPFGKVARVLSIEGVAEQPLEHEARLNEIHLEAKVVRRHRAQPLRNRSDQAEVTSS